MRKTRSKWLPMLEEESPTSQKGEKQSKAHLSPRQGHMGIWSAIGYLNSSPYQVLSNPYSPPNPCSFYSTYLIQRPGFLPQQLQIISL
jgi:hypothetical protein